MAFGDLKVQDLIYEDSSNNEITVVLSDLVTKNNTAFTGNTTGVNLTLSGDLTVNGTTTTINTTTLQVEDKNVEIGKVSSPSDTTADNGGWTLLGATNKTFNWVNATDAWTSSEHIHLGDNKKLLLGTGSDLQISHDGSNSYINNSTGALYLRTGTGLNLQNAAGTETYLYTEENGAVFLRYDNVTKFETTSGGVKIGGYLDTNDNNIVFGDSADADTNRITMGAASGGDLKIYHDGTDAFFSSQTGNIDFRTTNAGSINLRADDKYGIYIQNSGTVRLYHDNAARIETTAAGATISGSLTVGGISASGYADFTGLLSEACTVTAGKLSDNTNLDAANGNVFLFTTQETTTCTPNIRWDGSTTLNSKVNVGDMIAITVITTAAAGGYSAQLTIDGAAVTENWIGGSAPSAGGSSGKDIYSYTIVKTADATFTIIGNLVKTSS